MRKKQFILGLMITLLAFPLSGLAEDEVRVDGDAQQILGNLEEAAGEEGGPVETINALGESAETAVDQAGEAPALDAAVSDPRWEGVQPDVKVSKWGSEMRIIVTPSADMKSDELLAIKSVKMESPKGEFLGLKTYNPDEKERGAEFMVNPEILSIDAVTITVTSTDLGDFKTTASLVVEEEAPAAVEAVAEEVAAEVAAVPETEEIQEAVTETAPLVEEKAQEVKGKPKKKGMFW